MSCGCDCIEPSVVSVSQLNDCTTIIVDGVPYTICVGDTVTCTEMPDGSHVLGINGVNCVIPAAPTVSVVDNGDCTATITINGVATTVLTCTHAPAVVSDGNAIDVIQTGPQGFVVNMVPLAAVTSICSTPAAKAALVDCVLSNDASNAAVLGSDGAIYVAPAAAPPAPFVHPTPLVHVTDICANPPAKAALVDCVLSNDAGNVAVLGSDGAIYVAPAAAPTYRGLFTHQLLLRSLSLKQTGLFTT
jgi:hypothetical protein